MLPTSSTTLWPLGLAMKVHCSHQHQHPSVNPKTVEITTSTWELIQYKTLQHMTHTKANHHEKHLESSCSLQTLLMPKLYVVVSLPDWTYKIKIAQMSSKSNTGLWIPKLSEFTEHPKNSQKTKSLNFSNAQSIIIPNKLMLPTNSTTV